MANARRLGGRVAKTPLHPQWLLHDESSTAKWIGCNARGTVLDIGCANRWVEDLLSAESAYVGLDYPATGKHLYGALPDVFANAARLPFADCSVDTVVMLEVLEHLRAPQEALREIGRVLRPKGRLLLSVPFLYPLHDEPHDYQRLTCHGLEREIEAAGLQVDRMMPRLNSAETAGLIASLTMAGMVTHTNTRIASRVLILPLIVATIPVVNVLAWCLGQVLPSWHAVTNGYQLTASKR